MRAELASMWSSNNKAMNLRKMTQKAGVLVPLSSNTQSISKRDNSILTSNDKNNLRDLLHAVLPFDLLMDRRKMMVFLNDLERCSELSSAKCKVVHDAGVALASLVVCEEALERELLISTSYIPGMEVTVSSRLKSLYSIYCKMKRKNVDIGQVYDARALRVIIGDRGGKLHGPAVKSCYNLLNIVHRLWSPIDGEFDDYIINPKPSGYQSLHTAVQGPDCYPLEVQIRTQRMHEYAEFGLAAHWLYKEAENNVRCGSSCMNESNISASSCKPNEPKSIKDEAVDQYNFDKKYSSLKAGHPVLRVNASQLLAAVIVSIDQGGLELLLAVSFEVEASEVLADRRYSIQGTRWEAYARLYKKVSEQWWFAPGYGDWSTCLEKYTLCRDGIYHKEDQFQRLLPTFIQIIELTDNEKAEYWSVVSAVFDGKEIASIPTNSNYCEIVALGSSNTSSGKSGMNNKVQLLRTMLHWEERAKRVAFPTETNRGAGSSDAVLGEVVIICWPNGKIMRMRSGSTAADVALNIGSEGKLVLLNGHFVLPHTELKDGDIVEVRL